MLATGSVVLRVGVAALLVALCLATGATAQFGESCKPTVDGNTYDLSPLDNNGVGYPLSNDDYDYTVAFCTPLADSSSTCSESDVAVCQRWTEIVDKKSVNFRKVLGKTSSVTYTAAPSGNGIVSKIGGGKYSDTCKVDNNVELTIECDESVTGDPVLAWVGKDDATCTYKFSTSHQAACIGSGSGAGASSGGAGAFAIIFLILVFTLPVIYLGVGMAWKKKRQGMTGMEMVPNIDFWRVFPGYVGAGCKYTFRKLSCKKGAKGYDTV